jgi:predicted SAM-dependent methyltransferase
VPTRQLREVIKGVPVLARGARRGRYGYRAARSRLGRRHAIEAYLAAHDVRALQLGAFDRPLPGWLNTDVELRQPGVIYLDATRSFPLPTDAFDYVHSEHVIEHLTYAGGRVMLRESCRVLRPGGIVRVATPSLDVLIGLFTPDKTEMQERYIRYMVDRWMPDLGSYREALVFNNTLRNWGHLFVYDEATLREAMERAGLVDVRRQPYGESDVPMLRGLEKHGMADGPEGEAVGRFETLVLEGRKPG